MQNKYRLKTGALPKRIMIFGRSGSGKSTFALQLHKMTKIPLHHLDKYFYELNWIERNYLEFLHIQQTIVDTDSWIIDGNQIKSLEMRYAKAGLVLYFNYPRWLCYWRIFKRLFSKNTAIDDRAPGCKESIRFKFLKYMWGFENRVAPQIKVLKEKYPDTPFIEIKNDAEIQMFRNKLTKGTL